MPEPREQIYVCDGCGATAGEDGEYLDPMCKCGEAGATWVPLIAAPLDVPILDPVAGIPNEYARRVRERLRADVAYLLLQADKGHAEAAGPVCAEYGHDARAGLCMRCGARLARTLDEEMDR